MDSTASSASSHGHSIRTVLPPRQLGRRCSISSASQRSTNTGLPPLTRMQRLASRSGSSTASGSFHLLRYRLVADLGLKPQRTSKRESLPATRAFAPLPQAQSDPREPDE